MTSEPLQLLTDAAHDTSATPRNAERVVLLDDDGRPSGTMLKSAVHGRQTPLHSAFSTYGFDGYGRLLLTRRATTKTAWPGVWTNTCCGHPAPGESLEAAVTRRLDAELGMAPLSVTMVLPAFRYSAVDASGIMENEICPVLFVELDGDPAPAANEVAETQWVHPQHVVQVATDLPFLLSPWAVMQIAELTATGQLKSATAEPDPDHDVTYPVRPPHPHDTPTAWLTQGRLVSGTAQARPGDVRVVSGTGCEARPPRTAANFRPTL